jgi:hypothetical protein
MIDNPWEAVLEPYAQDPAAAFMLAQTLFLLKEKIKSGPEGSLSAIQALEQGIETLYPYTDAHEAAHKLYLLAVEGKLLPKDDPTFIARALGCE